MRCISLILFFILILPNAWADGLSASMKASEMGMRAQSYRLKVISENVANSNVTGTSPQDNPYRRKMIFFKTQQDAKTGANIVVVDKITDDLSNFELKYEPNHPAADAAGYVKYPNVNLILESVDAKEAQRTFEANLSSFNIAKSNREQIIGALK